MRRLLRFFRLPSRDRRLLLRAFGALVATRVRLGTQPFQRVFRRIQGLAPRRSIEPDDYERVGWAVRTVAPFVPGARCLAQALACKALLAERGRPADLRIGVAPAEATTIEAHAWLEHGGAVVFGDPRSHEMTPLSELE